MLVYLSICAFTVDQRPTERPEAGKVVCAEGMSQLNRVITPHSRRVVSSCTSCTATSILACGALEIAIGGRASGERERRPGQRGKNTERESVQKKESEGRKEIPPT